MQVNQPRKYDEIVRSFITQHSGHIAVLSQDVLFIKTLRSTVAKHLVLPPGCFSVHSTPKKLVAALKTLHKVTSSVLVLVEREIEGVSNIEFLKYLRMDYPSLSIIILTEEIEREKLILLHEMGSNNCITKPISVNVLIEKIAFTIQPPSKLGQLIEEGKKLVSEGDFKKALAISAKVLELKPDSAAGLMLRGDALRGQKRRNEAELAYEAATRNARMYLEPLKKLADFYKETGEDEKRLEYLDQLDRLSPLNVERKVDIGTIAVKMGDEERAREVFDEAVKITTKQAMGIISKVARTIAENCMAHAPEMAEDFLRRSLEAKRGMLTEEDVEAYNSLGIALRKQGKWREAIDEYTKALEVAPEDENLYYNMAMAAMDGKQHREAATHATKALEINPEFPKRSAGVNFNLGFIFQKANDTEQARRFFEAALALDPGHSKARTRLQKLSG